MPLYSLDDETPDLPEAGRYWIAPDAHVIGRVRLEEEVGIWFGAVLRGDNEPIIIGERTNVQDLCMVHTDPGYPVEIGADCTVGHRAIVHGCTIRDNSLIGMGAIILNGAVIGRNCLIGAGALIPENREIPDNSLVVGAPGKIIRALDDEAVRGLTRSAARYVAKSREYAHLTPATPG